jgi:hypothetical protein
MRKKLRKKLIEEMLANQIERGIYIKPRSQLVKMMLAKRERVETFGNLSKPIPIRTANLSAKIPAVPVIEEKLKEQVFAKSQKSIPIRTANLSAKIPAVPIVEEKRKGQVKTVSTPHSTKTDSTNLRGRSVNTDAKLRELERSLLLMDGVRLNANGKYGESDIDARSFPEWIKFAKGLRDPDRIRNCLYYGFQPLYDSLISGYIGNKLRPVAINSLNGILETSTQFLMSYYTGRPDRELFYCGINKLDSDIAALGRNVLYLTKSRNIDRNGIRPNDILSFLRQFLVYVVDNKLEVPDYVIGCACGASEIAIPLAGALQTNVWFLRKSKRRDDEKVFLLGEQEPTIKECAENKNLVCVEDYVCTSESLGYVMEKAASYKPSSVLGTSINFSHEGTYVKNFVDKPKFKLFKLSGYPWKKMS